MYWTVKYFHRQILYQFSSYPPHKLATFLGDLGTRCSRLTVSSASLYWDTFCSPMCYCGCPCWPGDPIAFLTKLFQCSYFCQSRCLFSKAHCLNPSLTVTDSNCLTPSPSSQLTTQGPIATMPTSPVTLSTICQVLISATCPDLKDEVCGTDLETYDNM